MKRAKRCTKCGEEKPLDDFAVDVRHKDGRGSHCLGCRRAYHARPRANGPRSLERRSEPRDGDRRQAQRRIQTLVEAGKLPPPSSLDCVDDPSGETCDGRKEYDHFLGYAPENHERVQVRCVLHHKAAEAKRRDPGEIELRQAVGF